MKSTLLILTLFAFHLFFFNALWSQSCQTSGDYEDRVGGELIDDIPFRCGTGMMEDQLYHERLAREEKGYYNIEGLNFWGSQGYYARLGELYYSSHPDSFHLIRNGDLASIRQVGDFVLDKNYLYVNGVPQEMVDVTSFEQVSNTPYAKDKDHMYYSHLRVYEEITDKNKVLVAEGANPAEFELVCDERNRYCYYYGKDKENVYYIGKRIEGADAASFGIKYPYAFDKNYVYYNGRKMEGSSGSTFEVLDHSYQLDENQVYCYGTIVEGVVGKNFRLLGDTGLGTDGVLICYGTTVFENGDPETFVDLGCGYSKDKNNVYHRGQIMEELDPATFEYIDWGFTKDKDAVYCDGEIIPNADPATFEILDRKYSRDANNVFYLKTLLPEAHRESFVVDAHNPSIASDKKAAYDRGVRVEK